MTTQTNDLSGSIDGDTTLDFFDAYTRIGPYGGKHPSQPWSLDHLLKELDHCSISGALVISTQSIEYDPMFGNLELCEQLEPHPHLFPVWNAIPSGFDEFPSTKEFLGLMEKHGVPAVTFSPTSNFWDFEDPAAHELTEALQQRAVPVLLRRSELENVRQLARFLERFPKLPVILTEARWSEQRTILPLMARFANLHLTFDQFQIHYGPEFFHRQGWSDRMLFGSNAPTMSAGAHRAYVDYAEIPLKARQAMAGGNLRRLLGGVGPATPRINSNEDFIMTEARHGKPLSAPLIDMHMHVLHEGLHGGGGKIRMERGGPEGVFHLLNRLGCDGGGFMSWNGTVSCDSVSGNRCTRAALDVAPRGYWGLASFDPLHYSQQELSSMIPAFYESDPRFIGMKPYVRYGVPYDHASYDVWWEYGQQHRFYALLHRIRPDFSEVENLAARYPEVTWVAAHCGKSYQVADMAIEAMHKYPNIYAEITLTPVTCGVIDYLVEHGRADRVLYGSDLPMRDPRQQLGWVVYSRLSVEDKKRVLALNALQVIQPCLHRLPESCQPHPELLADFR